MTSLRDESGFTLLEVVLAVALLAFAASIVFPIFGQAPGRINAIKERQQAGLIAQSSLVELMERGGWSDLPQSDVAAVWQNVSEDGKWQWRAYEVVVEGEDVSSSSAPGRRLHILLQVKPQSRTTALAEVEEIFWVLDGI